LAIGFGFTMALYLRPPPKAEPPSATVRP